MRFAIDLPNFGEYSDPHVLAELARETVALDRLSGGRLALGVGLGSDMFGEISAFDGPLADSRRAEMLDESLAIVMGLWSGESFSFSGKHFRVNNARFLPTPIQLPRIPIWIAGTWPKKSPFRRAARYDGVVAVRGDIQSALSPAQVSDLVAYVRRFRSTDSVFDVLQFGKTSGQSKAEDREIIAPYAAAGSTWWIESMFPSRSEVEQARLRIRRGPPGL